MSVRQKEINKSIKNKKKNNIPCRKGKPGFPTQEIAITITHDFQLQNQQLLT